MTERKQLPLRLDPAVHDALARWAADELRSVNAQIELLLRDALRRAGRLPRDTPPMRPRGRPRRQGTGQEVTTTADSDALAGRPEEPGQTPTEPGATTEPGLPT